MATNYRKTAVGWIFIGFMLLGIGVAIQSIWSIAATTDYSSALNINHDGEKFVISGTAWVSGKPAPNGIANIKIERVEPRFVASAISDIQNGNFSFDPSKISSALKFKDTVTVKSTITAFTNDGEKTVIKNQAVWSGADTNLPDIIYWSVGLLIFSLLFAFIHTGPIGKYKNRFSACFAYLIITVVSFPPKTGPLFWHGKGICDGSETTFGRGHTEAAA